MAEDTEEPRSTFDRWSQAPVVGRRGLILAAIVPLLIAACGIGAVAWVARDSGDVGTVLRVPTSEWIPGQPTGSTTIQGTLEVDDQRCFYLGAADGAQTWVIWPAGYTARINEDGLAGVYDGSDHLVARDGQSIQMSGEFISSAAYIGEACLPGSGDLAEVRSEVTVTGP